ncbi:MAG: T9SS type A sorting domain-containing protein [Bacteroidetes bacterium]|nr:T9SS type A sorting domain-containing protein [Bacteroidota bacterium]
MSTVRNAWKVFLPLLLFAFAMQPPTLSAQGSMSLSTVAANNGQTGVSFDITALQSTKLYRFAVQTYSGSNTMEIWMNPDGMFTSPGVARTTGWTKLGEATFNATGAAGGDIIPYDIDLLMDPGDTWGFIIWRSNGTLRYRTGTTPFVFQDSYISINTQGWGVYGSVSAPTFGFYPRQFCGTVFYDEGCFFPDGAISYELLDGNLQPTSFASVPGSINLRYNVDYPDEATNVGVTVNFHNVVTDAIVYTYNFTASKQAGQNLSGMQVVPLPAGTPSGYLRVEVIFNSKNSCGNYADFVAPSSTLLLLPPGAVMCIVWPGDTDNNGIVNYSDRRSLNEYMHEANLRSTWLEGPTRFSIAGGLDYLEWRGQPSAPWNTSDGCYKDTDGNGVINNFDYIAIKLNWLKNNTPVPDKNRVEFSTVSFDMDQNYPNPFNPTTTIRYAAPERSQVRLVVTDMLGRDIATLVDNAVDAGLHAAQFDAGSLPSGSYIATVQMTGLESGLTFSKTINMALGK